MQGVQPGGFDDIIDLTPGQEPADGDHAKVGGEEAKSAREKARAVVQVQPVPFPRLSSPFSQARSELLGPRHELGIRQRAGRVSKVMVSDLVRV